MRSDQKLKEFMMNVAKVLSRLFLATLIGAPLPVLACHEVIVTMGKGLATQAYIAPNPANVLILYTDASHDREYAGLDLAGHHLTLVADMDELTEQLAQDRYDIVIAPLDLVDAVTSRVVADGSVRVVPVVSRDMRRDNGIRDRFDEYLVDGDSSPSSIE